MLTKRVLIYEFSTRCCISVAVTHSAGASKDQNVSPNVTGVSTYETFRQEPEHFQEHEIFGSETFLK